METFENGDPKSVTCHRFQSKSEHLSKMADDVVMLTHAQSQVPVVSSFSGVLVWIGENDKKMPVWMKIFCFVFAEMKTDTFEKALVWMGLHDMAPFQMYPLCRPLSMEKINWLFYGRFFYKSVDRVPAPFR